LRYERKYKIENLALHLVEQSILLHPASFKKIYPDRQVNNIYFDTEDLVTFKENVMGIADRKKYRVRWYGKNLKKINQPIFEIKIKKNQLGEKISNPFSNFDLSNLIFSQKEIQKFSKAILPLQPTLLNSYSRSYYGSFDGKFRITIDRNLRYFSLLNKQKFDSYLVEDQGIVMEIKYDESMDGKTDEITQFFPYRLTKSSKYVSGLELVNW